MTLELGIYIIGDVVCSNHDPRMTLTYLTSRLNFLLMPFNGSFLKKMIFLNTVKAKIIIHT